MEVGRKDVPIDPSFGSHFFQNISSLHVAYFTIDPKQKNEDLNLEWINNRYLVKSGKYVDLFQFQTPIITTIDSTNGKGIIYKPKEPNKESMDEEDSSGI